MFTEVAFRVLVAGDRVVTPASWVGFERHGIGNTSLVFPSAVIITNDEWLYIRYECTRIYQYFLSGVYTYERDFLTRLPGLESSLHHYLCDPGRVI